jgi:hypothetical protein
MRHILLILAAFCLATGCATSKPTPPAPKTVKFVLPNADWEFAPRDQVPPGFDAMAKNGKTKASILFVVFHNEHVVPLAMMMRDSFASAPGVKASPIEISDEKGVASFTVEAWSQEAEPRLMSRAKAAVRRMASSPDTEISALGGWEPQFDADMTRDFDAIVMAAKLE